MPSKKKNQQQKQTDKKAKLKNKSKAVEDKTFGLKNKKRSKKVQQYVQQVKSQDTEAKRMEEMAKRKAAEKKAAEKAKKEASKLLTSSLPRQKVPFGVDPKTILCEYFKVGACTRGAHCKFSHDMNVARKVAKRDIYQDEKDRKREEKAADTMDNWDEEKLRAVVKSKQGKVPTTEIVCKYFIAAVEEGKYGWFWTCPATQNGKECIYRHSLPPGFILKTKEQRRLERIAKEAESKITLEEYIESQRDILPKNLTPMTQETFTAWKSEHKQQLNASKVKRGKPVLTGREIVMKKYQDRFFREEELAAADDKGTIVDMSAFRKELNAIDEKEMQGIKDYGDGSNAFAEAN